MAATGIPAGMSKTIAGSKHFTRFIGGKPTITVGFDSSPDFTITKKYGLAAVPVYEKVDAECTPYYNTWRVTTADGGVLVGILREKTTAQIRQELG
jgi:hypothetical protein